MKSDRHIHGEGTSASQWQSWLNSPDHLPSQLAGGPRSKRLVIIAPHPDDEVLMSGGLLFMHGQQGGESVVIAVTDGEASHAGVPGWDPVHLSQMRRSESTAGLALLGVKAQQIIRLHIPDGQVPGHIVNICSHLTDLLRPSDRVVTTWRFDGHPDHEVVGDCAAIVCGEVGIELLEAPVWMWHWAHPRQRDIPWSQLRTVDLDYTAVQRKQQALACHVSQLEGRSSELKPVLEKNILDRCAWNSEYFFVTEGLT